MNATRTEPPPREKDDADTSELNSRSRHRFLAENDTIQRRTLAWGIETRLWHRSQQIPGIRTAIAQTLFGEIGRDFRKFRSASAFASRMGLSPDNEISGGKVLWVGTHKVNCRAATASRMAAQSLYHSKSALGDFYRRMRAKLGAPKAITAAAHKFTHHLPPSDYASGIR